LGGWGGGRKGGLEEGKKSGEEKGMERDIGRVNVAVLMTAGGQEKRFFRIALVGGKFGGGGSFMTLPMKVIKGERALIPGHILIKKGKSGAWKRERRKGMGR